MEEFMASGCCKNMLLTGKNSDLDTPAEKRLDYLEDICQENSNSGRHSYSEK
jgi:hypothetical protein